MLWFLIGVLVGCSITTVVIGKRQHRQAVTTQYQGFRLGHDVALERVANALATGQSLSDLTVPDEEYFLECRAAEEFRQGRVLPARDWRML